MTKEFDPFADPILRPNYDVGSPKRPMSDGWNRKLLGEGKPPTLSPKMCVDVVYSDGSRAFGTVTSKFTHEQWCVVIGWREHESESRTPLMDALAVEAGLSRRPENSWHDKMLGAPMPEELRGPPVAVVDVKTSNDDVHFGLLLDEVPDWRAVIRWRRSALGPKLSEAEWALMQNGRMREFLSQLRSWLNSEVDERARNRIVEKMDEFMRELDR